MSHAYTNNLTLQWWRKAWWSLNLYYQLPTDLRKRKKIWAQIKTKHRNIFKPGSLCLKKKEKKRKRVSLLTSFLIVSRWMVSVTGSWTASVSFIRVFGPYHLLSLTMTYTNTPPHPLLSSLPLSLLFFKRKKPANPP